MSEALRKAQQDVATARSLAPTAAPCIRFGAELRFRAALAAHSRGAPTLPGMPGEKEEDDDEEEEERLAVEAEAAVSEMTYAFVLDGSRDGQLAQRIEEISKVATRGPARRVFSSQMRQHHGAQEEDLSAALPAHWVTESFFAGFVALPPPLPTPAELPTAAEALEALLAAGGVGASNMADAAEAMGSIEDIDEGDPPAPEAPVLSPQDQALVALYGEASALAQQAYQATLDAEFGAASEL